MQFNLRAIVNRTASHKKRRLPINVHARKSVLESSRIDRSIQLLDDKAQEKLDQMTALENLKDLTNGLKTHPKAKDAIISLFNTDGRLDELLGFSCSSRSGHDIVTSLEELIEKVEIESETTEEQEIQEAIPEEENPLVQEPELPEDLDETSETSDIDETSESGDTTIGEPAPEEMPNEIVADAEEDIMDIDDEVEEDLDEADEDDTDSNDDEDDEDFDDDDEDDEMGEDEEEELESEELEQVEEDNDLDATPETEDGEVPEDAVDGSTEGFIITPALASYAAVIGVITLASIAVVEMWKRSLSRLAVLVKRVGNKVSAVGKIDAEAFGAKTVTACTAKDHIQKLVVIDKLGVILAANISSGFSKIDNKSTIALFSTIGVSIDAESGKSKDSDQKVKKSTYAELGYTPGVVVTMHKKVENILINALRTIDALKKAKANAKNDLDQAKASMKSGSITKDEFKSKKVEVKKHVLIFGRIYRRYIREVKNVALFLLATASKLPTKKE